MNKSDCQGKYEESLFAWGWLGLTFVLTLIVLSPFSIQQIPLYDNPCGLSTIAECNKNAIDKARAQIQNNLPSRLLKLYSARDTFPLLKFLSNSYELLIVDSGSESEIKISNPQRTFRTGGIDLLCSISSNTIILKNGREIHLGSTKFSGNSQQDIDNVVTIFSTFEGCTYLPKNIEFKLPSNTIMAPAATLSFNMLLKPILVFRIGWTARLIIFFGIFAIIGAIFALIKQFIQVAQKGILYFVNDNL